MPKKIKIVGRKNVELTPEQRAEHAKVRRQVEAEFPPAQPSKPAVPRTGIAAQIRRARKAQGLTCSAVAKLAGIPNSNTVRDIEYGEDAKLSSVQAVAKALGLKLEAVEA